MQYVTREEWLKAALAKITSHLLDTANSQVPDKVRVSCGFPSSGRKSIGECWSYQNSADETFEIFVCPTQANPLQVLAILLHEAVHAAVGLKAGHKAPFAKVAKAAGLEGKMTATTASDGLNAIFSSWLDELGIYPHATLTRASDTKQSTRLIKVECGTCGYTLRTTAKWLKAAGAPICPCNDTVMNVAGQAGEESGEE